MAAPAPDAGHAAVPELTPRRIAAFFIMVFGMFMAILDIQIVSASLPEIQAGLGASSDEISWVQTSYLIAEVVMIPLSGFLARMMSTRYLFAISAAGFTAASFLCATSSSINEMILWRGVQGFLGGGMIPSVFAAAFTIFPPAKRNVVSPLIGLVATLAAFLGAMEFVLEEGPSNDWFQDEVVAALFVVMVAGGIVTFWRAFTRDEPLVDLSAFADTNFAVGSVFSFVMGIGLYGMTYLYPLYLSAVRGYDSLMTGETVFVSGLAMFVSAPLAGILSSRMDLRLMLLCGFLGFGASSWMLTGMTADWDFNELLLPQILRGLSLMICMVPINNLALGTLPPAKMKGASGLYNLMRNLGGAVGLAMINTVLTDRRALHTARLDEAVTWSNPQALDQLEMMRQNLASHGLPPEGALAQMAGKVAGQAVIMSFIDVFILLTALFAGLALMALAMKPPARAAGGGGH